MSKRAYARHSSTQREGDTHGMHMNDTAHIRTPHTFGRAFFSGEVDSSACGAARLFPARGAAAGGAAAGGGAGRRECSCRQRQSASRRP